MRTHFLLDHGFIKNLADYRSLFGDALKISHTLSGEEIIKILDQSGLRGRGGGGYPTGQKWRTLFKDDSLKKYVVINAAEGEPGTFKDRMIIRKNPFAMLEGALIAAKVLKADEIYIGIKKSFLKERHRLDQAVKEFEGNGLLQFTKIHIVAGPEDYLFGEEKALLNVIEGIGPFPREAHLPPYEVGLFSTSNSRNPALVNNVETLARVPSILINGPESFRSLGTNETPGPLITTVIGDVLKQGVFEVEAGITLYELLYHHAEGPKGSDFKAILPGVSNGVITANNLHCQLDFKAMKEIKSGLGSASFIVYNEERSMPRVTQEVAKFLFEESCNQCTACKTGLGLSSISIDALFVDNPDKALLEKSSLAALSAPQSNRCYLPVEGSIIIPGLIEDFKDEFQVTHESKHLYQKETLPIIADFNEENNRFILKGEVPVQDEKYHFASFIDRATF